MMVSGRRRAQFADVRSFVGEVYGGDLHAKRIDSLAGAMLGVMQSASLVPAFRAMQKYGYPTDEPQCLSDPGT